MKKSLSVFLVLFFILETGFTQPKRLPNLIPYRKGDKWGFSNEFKKIKIPCTYASATPFFEGLARVSNEEEKYGFIDKRGKVVIPLEYDWAHSVNNGWIYVEKDTDDWGYVGGFIDKTGKTVVPMQLKTPPVPLPEFHRYEFKDGLMAVPWIDKPKGEAKYGYIDRNSKFVIKPQFQYATKFSNKLALVQIDSTTAGYINTSGQILFKKTKYFTTSAFAEGRARVRLRTTNERDKLKQGYIDTRGNVVVTLNYNTFNDFKEGVVAVQQFSAKNQDGQKWGFLNKNGGIAIPFQFEQAFNFNNGLALAVKFNKAGFINKEGREVIPFIYEYTTQQHFYDMLNISDRAGFQSGFAPVWKEGQMGFINRQGTVVVDFKYDGFGIIFYEYNDYSQGIALVIKDDKEFYIDMKGKEYYED
ncbi:hypothetical protein BKI52_27075 [marine bacterium AO1-C]|nr:hypothetical protein BKI52_27075 [marine bacterium AO1-C]